MDTLNLRQRRQLMNNQAELKRLRGRKNGQDELSLQRRTPSTSPPAAEEQRRDLRPGKHDLGGDDEGTPARSQKEGSREEEAASQKEGKAPKVTKRRKRK